MLVYVVLFWGFCPGLCFRKKKLGDEDDDLMEVVKSDEGDELKFDSFEIGLLC